MIKKIQKFFEIYIEKCYPQNQTLLIDLRFFHCGKLASSSSPQLTQYQQNLFYLFYFIIKIQNQLEEQILMSNLYNTGVNQYNTGLNSGINTGLNTSGVLGTNYNQQVGITSTAPVGTTGSTITRQVGVIQQVQPVTTVQNVTSITPVTTTTPVTTINPIQTGTLQTAYTTTTTTVGAPLPPGGAYGAGAVGVGAPAYGTTGVPTYGTGITPPVTTSTFGYPNSNPQFTGVNTPIVNTGYPDRTSTNYNKVFSIDSDRPISANAAINQQINRPLLTTQRVSAQPPLMTGPVGVGFNQPNFMPPAHNPNFPAANVSNAYQMQPDHKGRNCCLGILGTLLVIGAILGILFGLNVFGGGKVRNIQNPQLARQGDFVTPDTSRYVAPGIASTQTVVNTPQVNTNPQVNTYSQTNTYVNPAPAPAPATTTVPTSVQSAGQVVKTVAPVNTVAPSSSTQKTSTVAPVAPVVTTTTTTTAVKPAANTVQGSASTQTVTPPLNTATTQVSGSTSTQTVKAVAPATAPAPAVTTTTTTTVTKPTTTTTAPVQGSNTVKPLPAHAVTWVQE